MTGSPDGTIEPDRHRQVTRPGCVARVSNLAEREKERERERERELYQELSITGGLGRGGGFIRVQ